VTDASPDADADGATGSSGLAEAADDRPHRTALRCDRVVHRSSPVRVSPYTTTLTSLPGTTINLRGS
jgi:hypothetical protein